MWVKKIWLLSSAVGTSGEGAKVLHIPFPEEPGPALREEILSQLGLCWGWVGKVFLREGRTEYKERLLQGPGRGDPALDALSRCVTAVAQG